jgi:predicted MPP superfamily phosphohydrolase
VRILVFLLVSGLAHFLAARWVLSILAEPVSAKRRRLVIGVAIGLSLFLATTRLGASVHDTRWMRMTVGVAMIELGAVVISLPSIGLMALGLRGASMLAHRGRKEEPAAGAPAAKAPAAENSAAETPAPNVSRVTRRQAIERVVGTSVFAATTTALGWGIVRGRHSFALEEIEIRIKGWPRALDGYVIAQVSDVHVGTFVGDRELDEGFELVTKIRPDLVVATGDLVDFESHVVGPLAQRLMQVRARDGASAVLGNHDHYGGAADVTQRLRTAGVRVLCNEGVRLREGDGGGFALVGVDDLLGRTRGTPGFRGPDLTAALSGVDRELPRILLAHQPRYIEESAGRVALQLSGHTHGGQINPGFRPADLLMDYVAGRYERAGSTLYVNRGFGVAGPPSRVGAPPEVTKLVVVAA